MTSSISSRHTYNFEKLVTPHSKQRGLSRDVINPQDGHILCDRNPAGCGFSLRFQWSSRMVNITISSPKEILVAFMKAPPLGECCTKNEWAGDHSLKKPKVWEYFRWTGLGQKT